jgi:RecG-like helicase
LVASVCAGTFDAGEVCEAGGGAGRVELAKRGVETVEDLLYHLPFRYEDRLNPVPMSALKAGTMASVIGEVRGTALLQTRACRCSR